MSQGFQFFDIILFAMIAVFLILRLRGVLGRRDGHQGGFQDIFKRMAKKDEDAGNGDNVVHLADADAGKDADSADADAETPEETSPLQAGIAGIAAAGGGFDADEFVSGAGIAFEMVLNAYASGDYDTLGPLLSDDVYANFERSMRERDDAGQTMEETLVGIRKAEVVEAYMEGPIANVTVKFISDQVHALLDSDGEVVDGDPNKIIDVTDFWTFIRDTRTDNPNWVLAATRSLD